MVGTPPCQVMSTSGKARDVKLDHSCREETAFGTCRSNERDLWLAFQNQMMNLLFAFK